MVRGGVGRMKLKCGEAAKRSATRLPISRGELPFGQLLKSDCAAAFGAKDAARAATQATRNRRVLIRLFSFSVCLASDEARVQGRRPSSTDSVSPCLMRCVC